MFIGSNTSNILESLTNTNYFPLNQFLMNNLILSEYMRQSMLFQMMSPIPSIYPFNFQFKTPDETMKP